MLERSRLSLSLFLFYCCIKPVNMKNDSLKGWIRIVLILCGAALVAVLFVPMWRIDLVAPQYPEGLMLLIYPDKLGGNVDIINGLNHYIGMKTLHTEDFIEFSLLPYIIGFFAAAFLLVAVLGKRKWLNLLFILFVSFGILAMYDFWRWEYNYGHNLNPEAAIIVPGMAYQPPLIGFKQLLNFGAYSMPDKGGWIFVGAGVLLLFCTIMAWRIRRKNIRIKTSASVLTVILCMISLSSCTTGPEPLKTGIDHCHFCKMTISDVRFGAELITTKGKIYKFDEAGCLLHFIKTKEITNESIKNIYLTNFSGNHQLIVVDNVFLLKADQLRSPMGGNIAAFDNKDSMMVMQQRFAGTTVNWNELNK